METYQTDEEVLAFFEETFNEDSHDHHVAIDVPDSGQWRPSARKPFRAIFYSPFMTSSDELFDALAEDFDEDFFNENPEYMPDCYDPITGQWYSEDEYAMEGDLF